MTMTREQYSRFLDPIIREVYDLTLKNKKNFVDILYDVSTTELYNEKYDGVGAMGMMEKWDGQVHYDTPTPLYPKTLTQEKYSIGLRIEEALWRFNQHNKIKDKVKSMADGVFKSLQYYANLPLNNAVVTALADGQPLGSASHPYSPEDASVQSNLETLALTPDNLDTIIQNMNDFKDDRGHKLLTTPNCIIVPTRRLYVDALKIVGSEKEAFVADNQINTFKNEDWEVIYNPYLTTTTRYFVVDKDAMKSAIGMKWLWNKKPKPEQEQDFDTEVLKWKTTCWFANGPISWQWAYIANTQ